MDSRLQRLCTTFERTTGRVQELTKPFCDLLGITTFGYVRVYNNQTVSWVTSNPEQDHFLLESGALQNDPLFTTKESLSEGAHLWFHDKKFPGSTAFYKARAQRFQLDHGMVLVRHQENYVETCCFSGLLAKTPLYNTFVNQKGLFSLFMDHFTRQLKGQILTFLEEGIPIDAIKGTRYKSSPAVRPAVDQAALSMACGWKNLTLLSPREKQCLVLLKEDHTFQGIGAALGLSTRTVEHYIESVKNKLDIETRQELYTAAKTLCLLLQI